MVNRLTLLGLLLVLGPYAQSQVGPLERRVLGAVDVSRVPECSGLVASRRYPGRLYTVNDHGNAPLVHALDTLGHLLGSFTGRRMANHDWEEVSLLKGRPGADGQPAPDSILVCDIGDNLRPDRGMRHHIRLYRLPEPEWVAGPALADPDSVWVQYEDGARDAEALLPDPLTGELIIVTKRDVPVRVYRLRPVWDGRTVTAQLVTTLPGVTFITGGSVRPDGRAVLVRNLDQLLLYTVQPGEPLSEALKRAPTVLEAHARHYEDQGEAIAWAADGQSFYSLSEANGRAPHPRLIRLHWRR